LGSWRDIYREELDGLTERVDSLAMEVEGKANLRDFRATVNDLEIQKRELSALHVSGSGNRWSEEIGKHYLRVLFDDALCSVS